MQSTTIFQGMRAAGYQGRYAQGHFYDAVPSQVGQMAAEAGAQVPSRGANTSMPRLRPLRSPPMDTASGTVMELTADGQFTWRQTHCGGPI